MATKKQLEEALCILNENSLIPDGVDFGTRLELIGFKAKNYEYWNHKYAEDGEHYDNSVVALLFKHSMVEKPFWIVLFKGAQLRDTDVDFASAFWDLPCLDDAIYASNGISKDDVSDGCEVVRDIAQKFDYLWFEEDEASEDEPLIYNNSDTLYWLADELESILNVKISLNVPIEEIQEYHIVDLEKALADAKEAYSQNTRSVDSAELKSLIGNADAISIDGSPLLTNIYCDGDTLINTKWNEDDLEFECSIEYDDIKSIVFDPVTKIFTVTTDDEVSKIEIYTLNKLGGAE